MRRNYSMINDEKGERQKNIKKRNSMLLDKLKKKVKMPEVRNLVLRQHLNKRKDKQYINLKKNHKDRNFGYEREKSREKKIQAEISSLISQALIQRILVLFGNIKENYIQEQQTKQVTSKLNKTYQELIPSGPSKLATILGKSVERQFENTFLLEIQHQTIFLSLPLFLPTKIYKYHTFYHLFLNHIDFCILFCVIFLSLIFSSRTLSPISIGIILYDFVSFCTCFQKSSIFSIQFQFQITYQLFRRQAQINKYISKVKLLQILRKLAIRSPQNFFYNKIKVMKGLFLIFLLCIAQIFLPLNLIHESFKFFLAPEGKHVKSSCFWIKKAIV